MEISLLIVAVIIGLIALGIRSSKKRIKRKITLLLNIAKFAAWDICHPRFSVTPFEEAQANLTTSAAVNFLFGESANPLHNALDLPKIHAEAIDLLERNDSLRELIVQSLRVSTKLDFLKGEPVAEQKISILSMFGKEYPIAPTPDSYERLIRGFLNKLTPEMKQSIQSRYGIVSDE